MRIKINISFILFLFIGLYLGYKEIIFIIFFSVIFHELGHGAAAKALNTKILEIQFFPFGAIAFVENMAKYGDFRELIIALFGPLFSLALALLFFYNKIIAYDLVFKYNMALFLFNLIPALPLDGGRAARSILLMRFGYKKATKILTNLGKLLAILLLAFNVYLIIKGDITITLIITAVFIFIGAVKEEKNCSYVYLLNKNNKKERLLKKKGHNVRVLKGSSETFLKDFIDQFGPMSMCRARIHDSNGNIIAELNEAEIMNGFLSKGYYCKVRDIL